MKQKNNEKKDPEIKTEKEEELKEQEGKELPKRKFFEIDLLGNVEPKNFHSFDEACGALVNRVLATSEHPLYVKFMKDGREGKYRNCFDIKVEPPPENEK